MRRKTRVPQSGRGRCGRDGLQRSSTTATAPTTSGEPRIEQHSLLETLFHAASTEAAARGAQAGQGGDSFVRRIRYRPRTCAAPSRLALTERTRFCRLEAPWRPLLLPCSPVQGAAGGPRAHGLLCRQTARENFPRDRSEAHATLPCGGTSLFLSALRKVDEVCWLNGLWRGKSC
jgi:hypothetical protein